MNLNRKAFELREVVLDMIMHAKTGHIGGDYSVMEILVDLYYREMNVSPSKKDDPNRDYFILSKGHSVEAYYAVLGDLGFISKEDVVNNFAAFGSKYIGHPNNELDGIEMNSGSLGHGLPVAVGMAKACAMDKRDSRVYVVMGDGELAEGSCWEGFMAGGHYGLDNLCAIVDRNHLQISGTTEEVMTHANLHAQIESFGWQVIEVNGNDIDELDAAFKKARATKGMPTCIIANTIKGYGCGSIGENVASWHHHVPNDEEYAAIKANLKKCWEEV